MLWFPETRLLGLKTEHERFRVCCVRYNFVQISSARRETEYVLWIIEEALDNEVDNVDNDIGSGSVTDTQHGTTSDAVIGKFVILTFK